MKVTVAICTWNRARQLSATLENMRRLSIPEGVDWEILVVNNNCTDSTDEVVRTFVGKLPMRLIHERTPGKSHAANLAMAIASGDLLLWTDDDVLVDSDWISAYVGAAYQFPDADYFGGQITPWFESRPPTWISLNQRLLEGMLVIKEVCEQGNIVNGQVPYGANMAFRFQSVKQFKFDTRIGPNGCSEIRGEEVELIGRFRAAGLKGVWVPAAKVRHFVSTDRASREFMWKYYVGSGRTWARTGVVARTGRELFGAPRWMYRRMAKAWLASATSRLRCAPSWVVDYIEWARWYGIVREMQEEHRRCKTARATAS